MDSYQVSRETRCNDLLQITVNIDIKEKIKIISLKNYENTPT